MRVISLGITEVVHQFGELIGQFVGVAGSFVLILLPFLNIIPDKEAFSHWSYFCGLQNTKIRFQLLFLGDKYSCNY
jgi:hypothetical protein